MRASQPTPPRWADAILRTLLRPTDRESISGDLLEEYRAVRRPALGPLRADVWYIRQVVSVLWRLIWPGALVLAAQGVFLALTVFHPGHHAPHPAREAPPLWLSLTFSVFWYGSVVGAPGVSLLDATIYFVAACRGVQRTRLIRTGAIAAAATSVVGFAVLFTSAALVTPGLAVALLVNPPLLLILSAYLLVPLSYAVLVGAVAGIFARWILPLRGRTTALPPA